MKKLITNYTFDASAKTITSASFTSLEKIQLITNVTDNVIIYNFADPAKGGSLSGTTLTLDYDTTSMDDADKLQIFVDEKGIEVTGTAGSAGVFTNFPVLSSEFSWGSLQLTGTWVGTVTFQGSNDNSTWVSVVMQNAATTNAVGVTTATANGIFYGPLNYKYFRANMTAYTSGTATATGIFTESALALTTMGIGGGTLATVTTVGTVTSITNQGMGADNGAFTDGTTRVMINGYIFDEVAGTALTENDMAAARIDSKRAQVGVIEDATTRGQRAAVTASNALKVDNSAVTQPVSDGGGSLTVDGTVTANLAAGTNNIGDVDVLTLPALPAGNNNIGDVDVASLPVAFNTGTRSATTQRVTIATDDVVPISDNGGSITVDGTFWQATQPVSGTVTANAGTGTMAVSIATNTPVGNVAHDAADSGAPLKVGYKAENALSGVTLVADGDRTDAYADLDGVQIVRQNSTLADLVNGNASNTDGASTQVIAASGAGVKTYITDITLTNTSASNIYVELKDGSTAKWTFPVPANSGVTHSFTTPLGGTANTAWNFDPSAATTTVYCSASGFKSKV